MNDLYGLLGSPLKCAKTIVTGSEIKKNYITSILRVLTYFIRCYSVTENVYDVITVENVAKEVIESKESNFEWDFDRAKTVTENLSPSRVIYKSESSPKSVEREREMGKNYEIPCFSGDGILKRNKSFTRIVDRDHREKGKNKNLLYPDIRDLLKCENLNEFDLDFISGNDCCTVGGKSTAVGNVTRFAVDEPFPRVNINGTDCLSSDEGYSTIDSNKAENISFENLKPETGVSKTRERKKNEIVFLLGDNEKLTCSNKKIVLNKPDIIEFERENCETGKFNDDDDDGDDVTNRTVENNCDNDNDRFFLKDRTLNEHVSGDEKTSSTFNNGSTKSKGQGHDKNEFYFPWVVTEIPCPE